MKKSGKTGFFSFLIANFMVVEKTGFTLRFQVLK